MNRTVLSAVIFISLVLSACGLSPSIRTIQIQQAPSVTIDPSITLTASDPKFFDIASGQLQLIEFFAYWCKPCYELAPMLHELEEEYKGRVKFSYIDFDDPQNKEFVQIFRVLALPEFILVDKDGKLIQQWVGPVTRQQLEGAFTQSISR